MKKKRRTRAAMNQDIICATRAIPWSGCPGDALVILRDLLANIREIGESKKPRPSERNPLTRKTIERNSAAFAFVSCCCTIPITNRIIPVIIEHIEILISSYQFVGLIHIKKFIPLHGPGKMIIENIIRINPMDKKILGFISDSFSK